MGCRKEEITPHELFHPFPQFPKKYNSVIRPCEIMTVCELFQKVKEGCLNLLIRDFDSHYNLIPLFSGIMKFKHI